MSAVRHLIKGVSSALLLGALALTGCGGSGSTTASKVIPTIRFKSPAISNFSIPARYTCDGADVSPPLEWGAVPANTHSLVLLLVGLTPEPSTKTYALSVEWAVAGIDPKLHRLQAGKLPPGAYLGISSTHGQRYSICPHKGPAVKYEFELYGLSANEAVAANFGGLEALKGLTESSGPGPSAHGSFTADYKRR